MVSVLTELVVNDADEFFEGFLSNGTQLRERHGCLSAKVFRVTGDKSKVLTLIEWPTQEQYEAFLKDPDLGHAMYAGGTLDIGKITYIEALGNWKSPSYGIVDGQVQIPDSK